MKSRVPAAPPGKLVRSAAGKPKAPGPQKERAEPRRYAKLKGLAVPPSPPDHGTRLLQESKSSSAALAHLVKGIRSLHRKDYRKARAEFQALLVSYSQEKEIAAKARSYLQICEREDPVHQKAAASVDQLYSLGVMEHNQGNYERAIAYFRQSLNQKRQADHIHYSLAASLASGGDQAGAIQSLRRSIDLNKGNRIYARNDPDFQSLRGRADFIALVGAG